MEKLKKIKLFLVIGDKEIKRDENNIESFIRNLNDIYEKNHIYFQLITDEDEIAEKDIKESEIFLILFEKKISQKIKNSFSLAYKFFNQSKKNPRITTFVKEIDGDDRAKEVVDFMDDLDKKLNHFYDFYNNVDTVKLKVILQLQNMGLTEIKIETKDNKMLLDGQEVLTLDNIPIFFNNQQLVSLKKEYEELQKKKWDLRDKTKENPDDDKLFDEYASVCNQCKQYRDNIVNLESSILNLERTFVEIESKDGLSPRQVFAKDCLNKGDLEGAKEALSFSELKKDSDVILKQIDFAKEKAQIAVNEYVQRAETLKLDIKNKERFKEIEKAYEEAILIEEKAGLIRDTLHKYSDYLLEQKKYQKALDFETMYVSNLEYHKKDIPAYIYNGLGNCYDSLGKYHEAITNYQKALDIFLDTGNKDGQSYDYDELGNVYKVLGDYDKALELLNKALKLREELASEDSYYEQYPAYSYNNIANVYLNINDYDKSLEYYQKALDIHMKSPKEEEDSIRIVKSNLGKVYKSMNKFDEAEKYYIDALEIAKKRFYENTEANVIALIDGYHNLACFYDSTHRYVECEKYYMQTLELADAVLKDNEAYASFFTNIYDNISLFYLYKKRNLEKAMTFQSKAIEILEKLVKDYPEAYSDSLANTYYHMGLVYANKRQSNEQLEYYQKALKIREELYQKNPIVYEDSLASLYYRFGNFYRENKKYEDALEYYQKSIDIQEKLSDKYFSIYADSYADSLLEEGYTYLEMKKYKKSLDYFNKALEIRQKLYDSNPDVFAKALSDVYYYLARVYNDLNQFQDSLHYYQETISIREKLNDKYPLIYGNSLANVYNSMIGFYIDYNDYENGILYGEKALVINEKLENDTGNIGMYLDSIGHNYHNTGICYYELKDYDKALECFYKAVDVREKMAKMDYDSNIDNLLVSYSSLGICYKYMEKYDKALEYLTKVLDKSRELSRDNPIAYLSRYESACDNLAGLYQVMDEHDKAVDCFMEAIDTIKSMPKDNEGYFKSLIKLYSRFSNFYYVENDFDSALKWASECKKVIESAVKINHDLYMDDDAELYNMFGYIQFDLGKYDIALENYMQSMKLYEKLYQRDASVYEENLGYVYKNIADVYDQKENYKKVIQYAEKSLKIFDNLSKKVPKTYMNSVVYVQYLMAFAYDKLGDNDKALELYLDNIKKCSRKDLDLDEELASSYKDLADYYMNRKDYKKVLTYYEKSRDIWKKCVEKNEKKYIHHLASLYNLIGNLYYDYLDNYSVALDNYELSLTYYQKACEYEQDYESSIAMVCANIGFVYNKLKKYDEALNNFVRSYDIRKKLYDKEPDSYRTGLVRVSRKAAEISCNEFKKYDEACKFYKVTIDLDEELYRLNKEKYQKDFANDCYSFANVYFYMKDYNRAIEYDLKCIEIREGYAKSDKELSVLASTYYNTYCSYDNLDDYKNGLEYALKCLAIYEKIKDSGIARGYYNVAKMYYFLREYKECISYYDKAIDAYGEDITLEDKAEINFRKAFANNEMKEYEKAEELYNKAIDFYRELKNKDKQYLRGYANCFNNIFYLYFKKKNYDKCIEVLLEAISVYEELYHDNPQNCQQVLMECYQNISVSYRKKHQFKKAIEYGKKFAEIKLGLSLD